MNLIDENPILGAEPTPEETKLLLILKIVFIFVIFGIALGFGVLPAKVKSCGRNPKFMSMANAFSGGLFLAIALIHILPDVINDYTEYLENNPATAMAFNMKTDRRRLGHGDEGTPFPLPFMLVFCGYTFILLVDKVMFDSHALFGGHDHGHGHGEEGGHDHGKKEHGHGHGDGHKHGDGHGHDHKHGDGNDHGHKHDHKSKANEHYHDN
jgi:zinc transporter ZupT